MANYTEPDQPKRENGHSVVLRLFQDELKRLESLVDFADRKLEGLRREVVEKGQNPHCIPSPISIGEGLCPHFADLVTAIIAMRNRIDMLFNLVESIDN